MSTWVCIAGGPSLVPDDIEYCRAQGWKLATCNMGFRLVPDAALFYAMDGKWWDAYHDELRATISADCVLYCGNYGAFCRYPRLRRVNWHPVPGWSSERYFARGMHSGMHLLQLVGQQTFADRIILLGYDYQHTGGRRHHHEDYPEGWKNVPNIADRAIDFRAIAQQAPIPVINCTRETALDCFPRLPLQSVSRETDCSKTAAAA